MNPDKIYHKPPLGIEPIYIWKEKRLYALKSAIGRRIEDGMSDIPIKWIEEYNELVKEVNNEL